MIPFRTFRSPLLHKLVPGTWQIFFLEAYSWVALINLHINDLKRKSRWKKKRKYEFLQRNFWPLCVKARVSMYLYKALVPISVYRTVLSYKKVCMYYVHRYTLYQYNIDMTSHTLDLLCLYPSIFSKRCRGIKILSTISIFVIFSK